MHMHAVCACDTCAHMHMGVLCFPWYVSSPGGGLVFGGTVSGWGWPSSWFHGGSPLGMPGSVLPSPL